MSSLKIYPFFLINGRLFFLKKGLFAEACLGGGVVKTITGDGCVILFYVGLVVVCMNVQWVCGLGVVLSRVFVFSCLFFFLRVRSYRRLPSSGGRGRLNNDST